MDHMITKLLMKGVSSLLPESACKARDLGLALGLGWEDPMEKGLVTDSSDLAWRIPWTEEPGGLQIMESESDMRK